MAVLKNAVNPEILSPIASEEDKEKAVALRTQLGIASDEIILGFAGELREKKGQTFLGQWCS